MRISPLSGPTPSTPTVEFKPTTPTPKDTLTQSSSTSSTSYLGSIFDAIGRFFRWILCCGEAPPPPPPPPPPHKTEFEWFTGTLNNPRSALFNNDTKYLTWPLDQSNPLDTIILENLAERELEARKGEGLLHKLCRQEGQWGFDPFTYSITHPMIAHFVNEKGVDVTLLDTSRRTALHFVQSAETVTLFQGKLDFNAVDEWGNTPLHVACNVEVARALMEGFAHPTPLNDAVESPLHLVNDPTLCDFFISTCDMDTMLEDHKGMTPLHRARSVEIAEVLCKQGGDAKRPSQANGNLPLHTASKAELVTFFLERYPQGLEQPNGASNSPLAEQIARLSAHEVDDRPLQAAITALIEGGASLDIQVNGTPLLEFILSHYEDFLFDIIQHHPEAFKISESQSAMKLMVEQVGKSLAAQELLVYQDEYLAALAFLLEQGAPLAGKIASHSLPQFCLNVADKLVEQRQGGQDEWRKQAFTLALIQKDEEMARSILDSGYPLPDVVLGELAPKAYCEQNGLGAIADRL
ncbi:MAG: hypothetical protein K940chlam2_00913 [Chlamydiae bacterium]|nr:hypothetical protein [Chlamydiota bacterium]